MAENGPINSPRNLAARIDTGRVIKCGLPILVFLVVLLAPTPAGLTEPGQRALAVMLLAVVLWATEALPIAVTGLLGIVLLVITGAVPDEVTALYGFSRPVAYFLIGILGLGLAVHQSGMAERMASYLIRVAGGSPRLLATCRCCGGLISLAIPLVQVRTTHFLTGAITTQLERWLFSAPGDFLWRPMGSYSAVAGPLALAGILALITSLLMPRPRFPAASRR